MPTQYSSQASQVVLVVKNPPANARERRDAGLIPGSGRSPGGGAWQPSPVFLPGESHGQRCLAGYSPQGRKELDTTEATQQVCKLKVRTTGTPTLQMKNLRHGEVKKLPQGHNVQKGQNQDLTSG